MNHLSEEELVLLYYNEPGIPEGARLHLSGCPQCRAASDSLARTLNLCLDWEAPEPSPWLTQRIVANIPPRPARWHVWGLAFAALLLAAFFLGRVTTKPARPVLLTGLSTQARRRILEISLADHLERAGLMLTEISNTTELDNAQRERAQDLLEESRLMRQMVGVGNAAVLDEVERVMLEAANSGIDLAELRNRIASGSLIFKVHIVETNLRTQGKLS